MLLCCWSSVSDAGPTLQQNWVNVYCLLICCGDPLDLIKITDLTNLTNVGIYHNTGVIILLDLCFSMTFCFQMVMIIMYGLDTYCLRKNATFKYSLNKVAFS